MSRWEKWAELEHHHVVKLHRDRDRDNGDDGMHYLHALCLEDLSEIPQKSLDLPFLDPKKQLAANSCGGLLFFHTYGRTYGTFFLFNLTTKQWRSFFNHNKSLSVATGALGYDHKSDDYKMVRLCRERGTGTCAEVYSLKNDKQDWTRLDSAPPHSYYPDIDHHVYIAAAGKAYWLSSKAVVAFDFSENSFSYFDFPPSPYFRCVVSHVLVKLHDGLLGVVCYWMRGSDVSFDDEYPGYYYELWAWREEEEEWYRMFDPVCLCGGAGMPLGLVDGRLLLLKGIGDYSNKAADAVVLVYDTTHTHQSSWVYTLSISQV